jgi:hypothetical protein
VPGSRAAVACARVRRARARTYVYICFFKLIYYLFLTFILKPHPDSVSVVSGLCRTVLSRPGRPRRPPSEHWQRWSAAGNNNPIRALVRTDVRGAAVPALLILKKTHPSTPNYFKIRSEIELPFRLRGVLRVFCHNFALKKRSLGPKNGLDRRVWQFYTICDKKSAPKSKN